MALQLENSKDQTLLLLLFLLPRMSPPWLMFLSRWLLLLLCLLPRSLLPWPVHLL
jgi:hypothetical protein